MDKSAKDNKVQKPTPKKIRSLEEIIAEFATSGPVELSEPEERLVDRITFEQKGERFGRYASIKKAEDLGIPILTQDTSMSAFKESQPMDRTEQTVLKKELPFAGVMVRDADADPTQTVS